MRTRRRQSQRAVARSGAALSAEQLAAVLAPDGPLLIVAGPGSGKTTVLAERIGELVRGHRRRPERILAFAFTRTAARPRWRAPANRR